MTDETTWPAGFCELGGKTFQWTRVHRPEWCEFTLEKMDNPTGFFKIWKDYLLNHNAEKNKAELRSASCENRTAD